MNLFINLLGCLKILTAVLGISSTVWSRFQVLMTHMVPVKNNTGTSGVCMFSIQRNVVSFVFALQ